MTAPTTTPTTQPELDELARAVRNQPRPSGRPLVVATDGSRIPTPSGNIGGWAYAHATDAGQVHQESACVAPHGELTSSRMELRAVLEALRATRERPWVQLLVDCKPSVHVLRRLDEYLERGLTSRVGRPVADADLLVAIAREIASTPQRAVHVTWVKAHAATELNRVADRAARARARAEVRARRELVAA